MKIIENKTLIVIFQSMYYLPRYPIIQWPFSTIFGECPQSPNRRVKR